MLSLVENDRLVIGNCKLVIEENIRYLHAIVDLCNARNVQPVLVLMPVMGEYKKMLPVEQVDLYNEVLHELDSEAVCIDASEWTIPANGWYNATHLTKEASESFTQELLLHINQRII